MVTAKNIEEFFQKYKANLRRERQLNNELFRAEDQEVFIEDLRNKNKVLRSLFIENEAMLNLYLRPFIGKESSLTEELAEAFLKELAAMNEEEDGDLLICIRMAERLQQYYKEKNSWENWLYITHMLGSFYSRQDEAEDVEKSLSCFDLERREFSHYADIEEWEIRKRILFSHYNYCVVLLNGRTVLEKTMSRHEKEEYQQRIIEETDRALAVYDDETVRRMDGHNYDLDSLKEELMHDVYGNWICGCDTKDDMSPEMFERSHQVLKALYDEAYEETKGNIFDIKDEIYCNYQKSCYYRGEISLEEYVDRSLTYFDYVLEHESLHVEEDDFYCQRYFQVNIYQIPNLTCTAELKDNPVLFEKLKEYALPRFKAFVEQLPRYTRIQFVDIPLKDSLISLITTFGTDAVDIHYYLNILCNRDESTVLHITIVKRLVLTLLQKILEKKPVLLVGTLKTKNVLEVLEKKDTYEELITYASLLYDIGKYDCIDIINMQNRRLEDTERREIHEHPRRGYETLQKVRVPESICEITLGHHKSYDGKTGYPEDYDNTASANRFLIDMFRICDCMAAATDSIGRIYNKTKTMQEFTEELAYGAGHQYNPDIVALIRDDRDLYAELSYICGAGRIALAYEAYNDFVSSRVREAAAGQSENGQSADRFHSEGGTMDILADMQELSKAQTQVVKSLAKSALLIARVNVNNDTIQFIHNSQSPLLAGAKPGSFREFISRYGQEMLHPDDYVKFKRLGSYGVFQDYLYTSDGNLEMEVRAKKDGDWNWLRVQWMVAEERNGVPQIVVLCITDIDSTKKKQEQIQAAMELASKQAEQANRAKSEFMSSMSHDIRTPMNIILGMTQIAERHVEEPEKVRECLFKIEQTSEHLLRIINEVLDMSKIESGKMILNEKPISLRALIMNILVITQTEVEKKQLTCTVDVDGIPEELVYGDAVHIQEILMNLISNAIKYTPNGRWISFVAEKTDEVIGGYHTYRFVVEDGGIGMSKEFLAKLFQPFAREMQPGTEKIEGTGLGLSITRAMVEMMQGAINVESTVGEGTSFEILLRFRIAEGEEKKTEYRKAPSPEVYKQEFAGKRILLTDDNALNREIFIELVGETGVIIEEAETGKEAVDMIFAKEEGYYDMVFMDIQMPVMNGYDAAKEIRRREAEERRGRIPILALTADAFVEDSDKASRAGMDGHISKPVNFTQLYETMERWFGNTKED